MEPAFSRDFMRAVLLKSSSISKIDRTQLEKKNWQATDAGYKSNMIISTNNVLFPDTVKSKAEEEEEKKTRCFQDALSWCKRKDRDYSCMDNDVEISCTQCQTVIATAANFCQVDDLDTFQLPLICKDCENPPKNCKVFGCNRVCVQSTDFCEEHIFSSHASADVDAIIFLDSLQGAAELPSWNFPN